MKKEAVFYTDWLTLPKNEFRILIMLAEHGGKFSGSLSDICRYFELRVGSNNRNRIKTSIDYLKKYRFVEMSERARSIQMKIIPKENSIIVQKEWVKRIRKHDPWERSVSWIQVVKVFLWVWKFGSSDEIFTRRMIADTLEDLSAETTGEALIVLERHYKAIKRVPVTIKNEDGSYQTLGQNIYASAFW